MGGRHYYLAREIAKEGHKVFLISGSFGHKFRVKGIQRRMVEQKAVEGFTHVTLRLLTYPNSHSPKRAINWFIFAAILGFFIRRFLPRPDAIVYSSPALIGYLGARRVAKKLNVPLVFEVRDIWPMTLIELGGFSPKHPFMRLMQWVEDKAYQESARVLSNLPNSVEHMVDRGMQKEKFVWIPNGISLDEVAAPEPLPEGLALKIPKSGFVVGYTGALGAANALDVFIDAAYLLRDNKCVTFVIVGDGAKKNVLKSRAASYKLNNLLFIDPIPKTQVQSVLQTFDACYISLTNDPMFKFGVSPNKLFDYMYSGKPIIYAISSGDYRPIRSAHAGLEVPPENPQALADAILELAGAPQKEREIMGQNARAEVLGKYEYGSHARKLVHVLESTCIRIEK